MKLGTASIILLFLISSCYSFVLQPSVFKRQKHAVVQSIDHNSEENLLIEADKVLGTKNLLQQVSQLLYKKYPTLVWDDSARSLTITFGNVKYISTLDDDKSKSLSNAIKKQFEINAVRKLLYYLYESSGYRQIIMGYLNDKLNKDNAASVLSRDEALQIAERKLLVVLVDTENVGDFRKVFYVDRKGEIRFASKPLPAVTVAPSLSADSDNDQTTLSWLERNQQTFQDEDILILSYAQAESQMKFRANRLSSARGRDAADYLILYDLGAIQRLNNLRGIFLITADRFGASVKECINEDASFLHPTLSLFRECNEAARTIGRLQNLDQYVHEVQFT